MKKLCANLKEHVTEIANGQKWKCCYWQGKKKNHTIIKKSVGYAKKNLMKKLMKTKATANYPYSKK